MRIFRKVFAGIMVCGMLLTGGFGAELQTAAAANEEKLELYARSAVLIDGDSGRILYGKNENQEMPMASTTKIMTCILALESGQQDQICTASGTASAQPKVKLGMVKGDTFYLKDLLYSLMLESHNDTAVCIAETVGGSVRGFAELMNAKAAEIGCTNTYYITPNGLDAQDETGVHHTTAAELAQVMRYCLRESPKKEEFLEITGAAAYSFTNVDGSRSYSCTNHNTFLSLMEGALSGKTGFTGNAGYCYVGALEREDRLFIVALLACGWPNNRGYKWSDTKKLMNYGLEYFTKKEIIQNDLKTENVPVENGQKDWVKTKVQQDESMELLLRQEDMIRVRSELLSSLRAPVQAGQKAGKVVYTLNGEIIAEYPVIAAENVVKWDYGYCLRELCRLFFRKYPAL